MEPNLRQKTQDLADLNNHRTEYQRLASTSRRREHRPKELANALGRPNTGGSQVSWKFSGKPFTQGTSNREHELKKGCGIFPRVWPDADARVSEVPVTSRAAIQYASTALASHGGITPRQRTVDVEIDHHKRQLTTWHEHDHIKSSAAGKQVRPLRVAGISSARLGGIKQDPGYRMGMEDRPEWMAEAEDLPGGYLFTPSDPLFQLPASARGRGDPTVFGKDSHFSHKFNHISRRT